MTEAYDGRQVFGIDLHRRRSVYRTTVCRSPSPFSQWRHTGLSQSSSR